MGSNTVNANTTPSAGRGQYARSEGTRAKILGAALVEATSVGFQNTSVAKIAARAGVAAGVLNYHFGSKQVLLEELMATQMAEFVSRLSPPKPQQDFFSYEEGMLQTYLEFLRAHPGHGRLAEEIRFHDPALYRRGTVAHVQHIAERLRAGVARGDIAALDETQITTRAYLMLGAYTFLDRLVEDAAYPGDAVVAHEFISTLRAGLAVGNDAEHRPMTSSTPV